jgi:hypothetical protein
LRTPEVGRSRGTLGLPHGQVTQDRPRGLHPTGAGLRTFSTVAVDTPTCDATARLLAPRSYAIPAGVDARNAASDTKVYYKRTYTKSQSRMDFYRRSSSSGSYCAITAIDVDTSVVNQNSQNWTWGKVTVGPLLTNVSACGADTHRKGIIAPRAGACDGPCTQQRLGSPDVHPDRRHQRQHS